METNQDHSNGQFWSQVAQGPDLDSVTVYASYSGKTSYAAIESLFSGP